MRPAPFDPPSELQMPEHEPNVVDEKLLDATVRLNTRLFAIVCGAIGGTTLLAVTYASLLRGLPRPGYYLSLLGVFLPGYSVTAEGAWIGLLWGSAIGALFGAVMYRVYARGIRAQVEGYLAGHASRGDIARAVLRLSGHSLGVALGAVTAIGLLVTTNWLVLRGTAAESVHAALLAQFLPGYSVSHAGSLVGALEVFVLSYAACRLFAAVHNAVVARRHPAEVAE